MKKEDLANFEPNAILKSSISPVKMNIHAQVLLTPVEKEI